MRKISRSVRIESDGNFNTIRGLDGSSLNNSNGRTSPPRTRPPGRDSKPSNQDSNSHTRPSGNSRAPGGYNSNVSRGNSNYRGNSGNSNYRGNNYNRNDRGRNQRYESRPRTGPNPNDLVPWKIDCSYEQYATFKRQNEIRPRPGEHFESLLKRFKNKCEKSGILKDARNHEFYRTKSQVARDKKLKAEKRVRKEKAKQARYEKRD